ncbi:hypothetical protein [Flavobacterium beibuense]|uniref:hypothetical protein n=1 Tax=Flavobacterium beibuense TaxID=657326 RepID=UPI003A937BCD
MERFSAYYEFHYRGTLADLFRDEVSRESLIESFFDSEHQIDLFKILKGRISKSSLNFLFQLDIPFIDDNFEIDKETVWGDEEEFSIILRTPTFQVVGMTDNRDILIYNSHVMRLQLQKTFILKIEE